MDYGALLQLKIISDAGNQITVPALIDTGSYDSGIDESLAQQLQLVPMGQQLVSVLNQPRILVTRYRARIEIPILGINRLAGLVGGSIVGKQRALLGRAQLLALDFVYGGSSGTASLTKK